MTARGEVRATGEPITLIGINLARIVNGKIVEHRRASGRAVPRGDARRCHRGPT
jgi:hypothetical protein